MMTDSDAKPAGEPPRGPFGDARPDKPGPDPRTGGSLPQENVEDRPNVSTVKPEDYPAADREIAKAK